LIEQLRQGGNFAGLARQFSQSATANLGGDLGWIKAEDLSEELNRVLTSMQPGQISPPIRTLTGFTILALRDQRQNTTTEVDRDRIEKSLKTQRVNQLAQRTLWQLRRNANVDIRI
jgi:peptidyl-prolyl cis-trans isomerase SurA